MSTQVPAAPEVELPPFVRVAVVAARFNQAIVDELLAGCLRRFEQLGAGADRVEVYRAA